MDRRGILAGLLVLSLVGCGGGGAHLDAKVAKRLAVAKASKTPAYWLGPRYDGLKLVYVESGSEAFFTSSLYYADCSWLDLNTLSPRCHRAIEVDNDVPTRGEISTMGRCIFSTAVQGVTVATFPVNPSDLRVFARRATIMVSARSRSQALKAIGALKPLNGHPLVHRDVSAVLGTCKAPPPRPPVHLTVKQRYEGRMKGTWSVESISAITLEEVSSAAKPKAVLQEFLSELEPEPALLRNEAERIEQLKPPADVATEQDRLVGELRSYADVVDQAVRQAKRDGLDAQAWSRDRKSLQPRLDEAESALVRTVKAFQARGYSIFAKPTD